MRDRMSRRGMLGLVAGAVGTAAASSDARAAAVSPRAVCSWQLVNSTCVEGTTWELWRYVCCDAFGCMDIQEELRPGASC